MGLSMDLSSCSDQAPGGRAGIDGWAVALALSPRPQQAQRPLPPTCRMLRPFITG